MKALTLSYLLTSTLLLTGCQSIQFFDSPIPVTAHVNATSTLSQSR